MELNPLSPSSWGSSLKAADWGGVSQPLGSHEPTFAISLFCIWLCVFSGLFL